MSSASVLDRLGVRGFIDYNIVDYVHRPSHVRQLGYEIHVYTYNCVYLAGVTQHTVKDQNHNCLLNATPH